MALGVSLPSAVPLSYLRYQRSYLWDVLLPDIGILALGLVGFGVGQLIQDVSFGDYSITNPSSVRAGPYQVNFAGMLEVDKVTMTFLKTMPDVVSMYLNAWKRLIVGSDNLFNVKANYQKTIYVRFLDSTGIAVGGYKFIGAFPITFPKYALSYARDEVAQVVVELKVDRVEYETF